MDEGACVATGAGDEPVQPAMLTALMSRIVTTTAHFTIIVSRLPSEAITLAHRREDRGSPLSYVRITGNRGKDTGKKTGS
jgi:hypothetical protein